MQSHSQRSPLFLFTLRSAVCLFCLGWVAWILLKLGTQTSAWFLVMQETPHATLARGEKIAAIILGLAACAIWTRSLWPMAALVGVAALIESTAATFGAGDKFAGWSLGAHGLRIIVPLTLAAVCIGSDELSPKKAVLADWALRLGLALVFSVHGLEAILQHAGFTDFLISTADRFLSLDLAETQTHVLLWSIGLADLVVAALVVFRPSRAVLVWMAVWGLITALSRVTSYGLGAYADVLLRAPHFLAPVAVLFLSTRAKATVNTPSRTAAISSR